MGMGTGMGIGRGTDVATGMGTEMKTKNKMVTEIKNHLFMLFVFCRPASRYLCAYYRVHFEFHIVHG